MVAFMFAETTSMKRYNHLFVFLSILLISNGTSATDFKLVKTVNGISLYERWVPHNGNTVRELKAVFEITGAGLPDIITLLRDADKGNLWNTRASQYKIAGTTDQNTWLNYIRYKLPWPMDDQDCCLLYHYREAAAKGETAEVEFLSTTDHRFPRLPKTTRITGTKGKWQMEPQAAGQLKITYTVTTDRSKTIPRWVSDPIIHDNLFRTMTKFKSLLENNHRYDR